VSENVSDFSSFAEDTCRAIALEETQKFEKVIGESLDALITSWGEQLSSNIMERVHALGMTQDLEVEIHWEPQEFPVITVRGKAYYGGQPNE
jgi:hypothetical protein